MMNGIVYELVNKESRTSVPIVVKFCLRGDPACSCLDAAYAGPRCDFYAHVPIFTPVLTKRVLHDPVGHVVVRLVHIVLIGLGSVADDRHNMVVCSLAVFFVKKTALVEFE